MNSKPFKETGFALVTAVIMVSVISLISISLGSLFLSTALSSQLELQSIKAQQLMRAGVRYAALSLASPRTSVTASAIPATQLEYNFGDIPVAIEIENEAGFIDLLSANDDLLKYAFLANGLTSKEAKIFSQLIRNIKQKKYVLSQKTDADKMTYRAMRELIQDFNAQYGRGFSTKNFMSIFSLYSGQTGVNPNLASESVLTLVPGLSKAERNRLLRQRGIKKQGVVNAPVRNSHFSLGVSAYYRVHVSVKLHDQLYSETQIIKMTNKPGRLFDTIARF